MCKTGGLQRRWLREIADNCPRLPWALVNTGKHQTSLYMLDTLQPLCVHKYNNIHTSHLNWDSDYMLCSCPGADTDFTLLQNL